MSGTIEPSEHKAATPIKTARLSQLPSRYQRGIDDISRVMDDFRSKRLTQMVNFCSLMSPASGGIGNASLREVSVNKISGFPRILPSSSLKALKAWVRGSTSKTSALSTNILVSSLAVSLAFHLHENASGSASTTDGAKTLDKINQRKLLRRASSDNDPKIKR